MFTVLGCVTCTGHYCGATPSRRCAFILCLSLMSSISQHLGSVLFEGLLTVPRVHASKLSCIEHNLADFSSVSVILVSSRLLRK